MTASVTFNFDKYLGGRTAFLIPLSALVIEYAALMQARGEGQFVAARQAPVFVVDVEGRLQDRMITIGDLRGNQLEVFDGLDAGERIVSAGAALLREGMTVELWSSEVGLTGG